MMEISDPESKERVADWVELYTLIEDTALSRAALVSFLEGALGREPGDGFLSDVWTELEGRARLYSDPPYTVLESRIAPSASRFACPEYAACLILSLYGVDEKDKEITTIFEEMSRIAVGAYLVGKAFVLGWGSQPGGTAGVQQKVSLVAKRTQERLADLPPLRFKDRGVDVVAYKSFPDAQGGQLVILVQSAAGANWRAKKAVPLASWCQYIHWACTPIKAFAFPDMVTDSSLWHEESLEKGILFDRARLIHFLANSPLDKKVSGDVGRWVTDQCRLLSR
jgi:hypothetical protein